MGRLTWLGRNEKKKIVLSFCKQPSKDNTARIEIAKFHTNVRESQITKKEETHLNQTKGGKPRLKQNTTKKGRIKIYKKGNGFPPCWGEGLHLFFGGKCGRRRK